VREVNGHDVDQVCMALEGVRETSGQPQVIVAHTLKGKGLSPFENDDVNRKHGVTLTDEETRVALAELDSLYGGR
jgi:transketolase